MENNFNLVELEPYKNLNFSRLPAPLSALGKALKNKNGQAFLKHKTIDLKSDQFGLNLFLFRHNVINSMLK